MCVCVCVCVHVCVNSFYIDKRQCDYSYSQRHCNSDLCLEPLQTRIAGSEGERSRACRCVACGTGILQHQNQMDYFNCLECNPFWSPFDPVVLCFCPPCFCPKQRFEDDEEIHDDDETEEDQMVAAAETPPPPQVVCRLYDDLFDLISPPAMAPTSAADAISKGLKRPLENPEMPKKKKKSVAKTDAL